MLLLPIWLSAQVKVQVITKTIEKEFSYQEGYELNIEGEKAQVIIEAWDQPAISITVQITAKHPDRSVAERDLEAMQYIGQKVKNKIYVRNFLNETDAVAKPESAFQAIYHVKVPEQCPVYLKNYFGQATISNLSNRLRFNGEFSQIDLQNIQGVIDLRSRFGDIFGQQLDGQVQIWARRSDITLDNIRGSFDITAHYGTLRLFAADHLLKLNIDAEHSDVFFYTDKPDFYAYTLMATHGAIDVPDDMSYKAISVGADQRKLSFTPPREYYANITITVTIGDVRVEKASQLKL